MPEKIFVIAEKPSVARDIARVMHCGKKTNTCLEGDRYIVTWALGIWLRLRIRRNMESSISPGAWTHCRCSQKNGSWW